MEWVALPFLDGISTACHSSTTKVFTPYIVKIFLFVVLYAIASANAMPSSYSLSDMMTSYMWGHFLNEAFPELNSPPLATLLSLPVDATLGMNQMVSIIRQAYHNQSGSILV